MDIKEVTSVLANDLSIGGTQFMDVLRQINAHNKVSDALNVSGKKTSLVDIASSFMQTIADLKKDNNNHKGLYQARLALLEANFKLISAKLCSEFEATLLYKKLYEETEEGKKGLKKLEEFLSDPKRAREMLVADGMAKEY